MAPFFRTTSGDLFGGDNTLKAFSKLLDQHRDDEKFAYAEYDIRESSDGYLVSYHDPILQGKKIEDLSLEAIRKLKPDTSTVAEIYAFAAKNNLPKNKPLAGDIKHLKTDKARSELLRIADSYKDEIQTWYIGNPNDVRVSFSDFHRWAVMFNRYEIPMYTTFLPKNTLNSQFSYMHSEALNFDYTTLLEKRMHFSKEDNRVQSFNVNIPKNILHTCLRLGVKHGYDDKGDGKSRIRVTNTKTKKVLCDLNPSVKGWQWVVLSDIPAEGVKVEWSDLDTPLDGNYPGNATLVNVTLGLWSPLNNKDE